MIRVPSRINISRFALVLVGAMLIFGLVESLFAGDVEAIVAVSNTAKNLARMNCGAQIECFTPDGNVSRVTSASSGDSATAALIMEDHTISRALQGGQTSFIILLPRTFLLNRFTFVNENAAARGDMRLSVSNYRLPLNSSKWTDVGPATSFNSKRVFNIAIPGIEAKYVRLSFHVEKEGRIAALGLYGEETLQRYGERQGHVTTAVNTIHSKGLEDVINFNFANLYARARVVYVSSGDLPGAARMIDDDTATAFRFSPTYPHPTVTVELADRERLHRATALYRMQSGQLEVYTMKELPHDPSDLRNLTPIATVADLTGSGKAAVDFNVDGARYVTIRWTPSSPGEAGFEVAEVGAFGDVPISMLNLNEAPTLFAEMRMFPGAPTEPPVIPVVSP